MATFVDTEEREKARLRKAEVDGLSQQTMTPVIKECLRLKILSDRHSHGLPEYQALFAEPVRHELRDDEKMRLERRRQQNKEAARRCREKKRAQRTAIENVYDEEVRLKTGLDTEIRRLQQQLNNMQIFLNNHLKSGSCLISHVSDPNADYSPDLCHALSVFNCQRQLGNLHPLETHQLDNREQNQEIRQEHEAMTSNMAAQIIEGQGQTFEIHQGHSRIVSDKERHYKNGQTLIMVHEGETTTWSDTQHHNGEPLQGHVTASSTNVLQFPGGQAPDSAMLDVTSCPTADRHFHKGVSQELAWTFQTPNDLRISPETLNGNLQGRPGTCHNQGLMAESAYSFLTFHGYLDSDQLHLDTSPRSDAAMTPRLESDDTNAEAAGHHSDHTEDIAQRDVLKEGLDNLILVELNVIPDELNGMYTAAGTGTHLTTC
ncbi:uncharacterized protein LOC124121576 [Haliotis rufescens]|uniref:uncharacterized protein LOC124121576 n=1 Tax=Haliotis rufescens TaxID=6454 RepID=UPI00201EEB92|nr:uncharacterized protein LOC124121576 [Haliotis rufescens]XP_046340546.2 uncharacterized protein LOC124121576 [Haliotis rufescens]